MQRIMQRIMQSNRHHFFFTWQNRIAFSETPPTLKSFVVYKYICAGCEASYIGQTTRYWLVRIRDHLKTDKNSHLFQHINKDLTCKNKSNDSCFSIIDKASTEFTLKIKEAIHIMAYTKFK